MKLEKLESFVREHAGELLCVQIHSEETTKIVRFEHIAEPPSDWEDLPDIGGLRDFYETFGSIDFYHDAKSGESGKYLASPSEWAKLHYYFGQWFDEIPEEERAEFIPEWVDNCLVVGETPHSGNYILVPTEGPTIGHIFEFEHDGFEFIHEADNIVEYVEKLLKLDGPTLVEIASHMRFMEGDSPAQWWIKELRDNRGHVVSTAI